jgi:hypothetical protein
MTLTEEQRLKIEKKADYLAEKKALVTQRKALLEELEYAESDMEEGLILEKRDALAVQIKTLADTIRQIEAWEADA